MRFHVLSCVASWPPVNLTFAVAIFSDESTWSIAKRRLLGNPFRGMQLFLLTVGSFLLTVELFYLQLTILAPLLTVGASLLTALAFLLTIGALLLTVGSASKKGLKGL